MPGKMDGQMYAPVSLNAKKVVKKGEFVFSVIGLDHGHIYAMVNGLIEAGAEIKNVYDADEKKVDSFCSVYKDAIRVNSESDIINDDSISLVVSAIRPDKRVELGLAVMHSGKHFFCDKPGFLLLEDIERVRKMYKETKKRYMVYFGERIHVEAAVMVQDMIDKGLLGKIVAVNILAPHRLNKPTRPDWFFLKSQNGGILQDIGSHQFEQLLSYTHSDSAKVEYSAVGNYENKDKSDFNDFGEAVVTTSSGASCFVRMDWFTPDGLRAWGDGRLFIVGTKGTVEVRKYVNVTSSVDSKDNIYFVDKDGEHYINATGQTGFPFFGEFILDCINNTDTAMTEEHVLESARIAITAQNMAKEMTWKN